MTFSRLIIVAAALADLAKHVDGTRNRLGGRIRVESDMCELSSGTRRFGNFTVISVYFHEQSYNSANPIRQTMYSHMFGREDFLRCRVGYDIDLTEFDVSFIPDHPPYTVTSNLQEAKQHFAPVTLFAHLNRHRDILRQIRDYLPITARDAKKCREIFDILANNPRSDFEKGVQWFLDFHVWANSKVGELISDWTRGAKTGDVSKCEEVFTLDPRPRSGHGVEWFTDFHIMARRKVGTVHCIRVANLALNTRHHTWSYQFGDSFVEALSFLDTEYHIELRDEDMANDLTSEFFACP